MPDLFTSASDYRVEVRDESTREIAIRLLPHGEIADRGSYTEEYAPSAHEGTDPTTVVIRDAHRRESMADIVGAGTGWEVRDGATYLRGRIAETPEGDRALAIARMGVLRASAGFYSNGADRIEQRGGRRHVVRDRITVVEAGLLTQPAYQSTAVEARAEEETQVTEQIIEVAAPAAPPVEVRADDRPVLAVPSVISRKPLTAADYALLHIRAARGDAGAASRLMEVRAAGDQTTGTVTDGALPVDVVGDLVNAAIRRAPLLGFFSRFGLPDVGMQFVRPEVDQHSLVGYQSAQLTAVATQEVLISGTAVNIFTTAGAVTVSRQYLDRTPYWQRVFADLVTAFANFTDAELAGAGNGTTAMRGLGTTGVAMTDADWTAVDISTDIGALAAAVYGAEAALEDGKHGMGADRALMSATTWARLASMLDGSKRPIFPTLGAINAPGVADVNGTASFFGLPILKDKNIPLNTIYLASADGCEYHASPSGEQPFTLSIDQPTTLGAVTSVYGYGATYFKPESIAQITLAAATP